MINNPKSGSSIPCKAVPLFAAVRRTICNQEKVSFLLPSLPNNSPHCVVSTALGRLIKEGRASERPIVILPPFTMLFRVSKWALQ